LSQHAGGVRAARGASITEFESEVNRDLPLLKLQDDSMGRNKWPFAPAVVGVAIHCCLSDSSSRLRLRQSGFVTENSFGVVFRPAANAVLWLARRFKRLKFVQEVV